jgi:hypothetical protein
LEGRAHCGQNSAFKKGSFSRQAGQSALLLQLAAHSTQLQGGAQLFKKFKIKFDNSVSALDNRSLIMPFALKIAAISMPLSGCLCS